jgi:hypothetical protein
MRRFLVLLCVFGLGIAVAVPMPPGPERTLGEYLFSKIGILEVDCPSAAVASEDRLVMCGEITATSELFRASWDLYTSTSLADVGLELTGFKPWTLLNAKTGQVNRVYAFQGRMAAVSFLPDSIRPGFMFFVVNK